MSDEVGQRLSSLRQLTSRSQSGHQTAAASRSRSSAQPATVIGSWPPCSIREPPCLIWAFQRARLTNAVHVAESFNLHVDLQPATVTEGELWTDRDQISMQFVGA